MTIRAASMVIGTAGHIDHGKTSLVRALTGVDLDAHPEEKERGITISLGFTPLDLPNGNRIALVDVPGHERLIRTMVAGATGVDAVMFCVSAMDGVMPQTREHLAILGLLGVRQGVVALTMADLVDADLLELAQEDVADLVVGTFLENKPIIPVSSVTGDGLEALQEVMCSFERSARSNEGVFRLPVDRAFVRSGFGTVVTGTAWSGSVKDGDQVTLLPEGRSARIRGIQVHGESAKEARAGWRTALNLAGIDREDAPRGTTVVKGDVPLSSMLDVRYHHLPGAGELSDGSAVRFLLGTAECMGRLYVAEEWDELPPGMSTWAQIRLERPVPCWPGDRFVIRRASPMDTLGGGEVVDPWAPKMRAKERVNWGKQIKRLYEGQAQVWLERAGETGLDTKAWNGRRNGSDDGVQLADRWFASTVVGRLEGALLQALEAFHTETPLSLGAHRRELRRGRLGHLQEKVFDALVDRLDGFQSVVIEGPLVRLSSFQVALDSAQEALQKSLLATLVKAGPEGLTRKKLHERHKDPEVGALMHLLEKSSQVLDVPNVGWVHAGELERLTQKVIAWFKTNDALTPGDFKELTGLSRRSAIPLLEWLDKTGVTRREGSGRVLAGGSRS